MGHERPFIVEQEGEAVVRHSPLAFAYRGARVLKRYRS